MTQISGCVEKRTTVKRFSTHLTAARVGAAAPAARVVAAVPAARVAAAASPPWPNPPSFNAAVTDPPDTP